MPQSDLVMVGFKFKIDDKWEDLERIINSHLGPLGESAKKIAAIEESANAAKDAIGSLYKMRRTEIVRAYLNGEEGLLGLSKKAFYDALKPDRSLINEAMSIIRECFEEEDQELADFARKLCLSFSLKETAAFVASALSETPDHEDFEIEVSDEEYEILEKTKKRLEELYGEPLHGERIRRRWAHGEVLRRTLKPVRVEA